MSRNEFVRHDPITGREQTYALLISPSCSDEKHDWSWVNLDRLSPGCVIQPNNEFMTWTVLRTRPPRKVK